ncbi:MAG TPA: DUF1028 domain-containing protein [Burkholderiales bacterium]|nr:DUF1028 domain-containing protein [Burkholderiales bacterium]
MTWSIVARDASGAFGVAIASRFFAVGALCPHARSAVGALSTQALLNPLLAAPALEGMAARREPAGLLAELLAGDAGSAHRQVHLIDAQGRGAAHTGAECVPWSGHLLRAGYSVAGNMLAGPQVVEATAQAYDANAAQPFALRLLAALAAGEAAGGDKRGKQAAALLIYNGRDYPALDMRVDDHAEPIVELMRLYTVSLERFQPFVECLASRERPAGLFDRTLIEAHVAAFGAAHQATAAAQASAPATPATSPASAPATPTPAAPA